MAGLDPATGGGAGADGTEIRTFLIADVRGYTLFTHERGDEAAGKLAGRFAEITGEIVESRGGALLELRGDEALCVFTSARDAIRAATDLQRRFVEETLAVPELPLTVGIGLDAGEAVRVADGYRGGALNLAARLCARARAGETLGSQEVTHLARAVEGVRYESRGEMRFKNLSYPVSVVRIVPTDGDPLQQLRPFVAKPPTRSRRWRAVLAAAAGVVVLALVAIAAQALTSNAGRAVSVGPNTLARLDPKAGSVNPAFGLDLRPGEMAVGFHSAWVVDPEHDRVVRLRLRDGSVADTIPVGHSPSGIAIGDRAVWVTNAADGTVDRIDVETNTVSQTLPAGSSPAGIAVGGGSLWVADHVGAALLRIDPSSGDAVPVGLDGLPTAVAFTPEGVWVAVAPGSVARVEGDRVTVDADVGHGPSAVTFAFGSIWVASELDASVTRVDPSTGRVQAAVPVGEGPSSLASAGGQLWVSSPAGASLAAIDPASDSVVTRIPVTGEAATLASAGGDLWLGVGPSEAEHRGGTLRVSAGGDSPSTVDPADAAAGGVAWQILSTTNDGLVAYRKVGGPDGVTVVPDLAAALPEISKDGLTYRFAVRRGVTYSNGDPVRPEDFRRALERSIALSGDAHLYFSAIVGADRCQAQRQACDLSNGIEVGDGSVMFHLTVPDGDLLFKLALPYAFAVPADTPIKDAGFDAVPATGPYVITHANRERVQLERNPRFRAWSSAAQPGGYPDAISIDSGVDGNTLDRLASGGLDVMPSPPRPEDLAVFRAEHPDRVFEATAPQTLFIAFDTAGPPFDDERVRQAVSYAIDRARLVDLLGGPASQRVTCQILPPNFQGYSPYCPFTRDPGTEWSAPDVDRARRLVMQAGAEGERVRVWASRSEPWSVDVMEQVAAVLDEIGLRARLEVVPSQEFFDGAFAPPGSPGHPNVVPYYWSTGYPGAWEFVYPQYGCGANWNVTGFCDRAVDRRIEEARSLQTGDPGSANRAWSQIEHDLVDRAALVSVANPISTFVVSERAGNVQINPQFGVLLSQIWVS
jgi:peptide/nickel transport system substrate-binding protein